MRYDQLLAGLKPIARRLRLRTGAHIFVQTAWLALGAVALFLLLSRIVPIENYLWIAAAIVGVWFISWLGYSALHRRTTFQVAQRADAELGLRDRLATALALSRPGATISASSDPALVGRQGQDALAHLQRIEPREAFPIRLDRRLVGAALIALVAIGVLLFLPNPMDAVIAGRREIIKTAQIQAQALEQLAKAVEENRELDPADQAQLLKKLRELAERLKTNPGDAEQALADIAKLRETLNNSLDLSKQTQAAALDTLASQIAQVANASQTPQNADELAKLLEQLAASPESLSEKQRAGMAQALAQTTAQVAPSSPELANALTELAQNLAANASSSELQIAVAQASAALQDAGEQQALQRALAQTANQADASLRAIARAANSSQVSDNQSQGQGQAQGQSQGQGQGQEQGTGQGQGGQGQGQGAGQGQGKVGGGVIGGGGGGGSGSVGGPNGQNKPFGADDVSTVYTPFQTGQGQQENVTGQDSGGGQTTTQQGKSPLPGSLNPAVVPYAQVFQQYSQIAGQAMENSYIPAGMKDYVKEYFSALEP
ncbi:MAG: hypothetical protein IT331_12720 [Anaerolineae bacterium]|nr:hypothetical protein [Anaerolineae bacterium]